MRLRAVLGIVFILAASNTSGQTTLRDTVSGQLDALTENRRAEGFTPDTGPVGRATMLGMLEDRTSILLELMLDAGREYVIGAGCDTDCDNLDTSVLTPRTFDVLVENVKPDDVPIIEVRPTQSGVHLLGVRMTSCRTPLCYFGVVVLSRPAKSASVPASAPATPAR